MDDCKSNSCVVVAWTNFNFVPNNEDFQASPTKSTPCKNSHTSMSGHPCSSEKCLKSKMLLPSRTTRAWEDNNEWSVFSSNLISQRSWESRFNCSKRLLASFWTPPHFIWKMLRFKTSGMRFPTSKGWVNVRAKFTNCWGHILLLPFSSFSVGTSNLCFAAGGESEHTVQWYSWMVFWVDLDANGTVTEKNRQKLEPFKVGGGSMTSSACTFAPGGEKVVWRIDAVCWSHRDTGSSSVAGCIGSVSCAQASHIDLK